MKTGRIWTKKEAREKAINAGVRKDIIATIERSIGCANEILQILAKENNEEFKDYHELEGVVQFYSDCYDGKGDKALLNRVLARSVDLYSKAHERNIRQ
jgi:altronate dehydratase